MSAFQSPSHSLPLNSYLSPHKNITHSKQFNALPTNQSFNFQQSLFELPIDTPNSKMMPNTTLFTNPIQTLQSQELQGISEQEINPQEIFQLQKWVLLYYHEDCLVRKEKQFKMELIRKLQGKNKERKQAIGDLKMMIESEKMKKRQKMIKIKLKQNKYNSEFFESIEDITRRTKTLEDQIEQLSSVQTERKIKKKKSKPTPNYFFNYVPQTSPYLQYGYPQMIPSPQLINPPQFSPYQSQPTFDSFGYKSKQSSQTNHYPSSNMKISIPNLQNSNEVYLSPEIYLRKGSGGLKTSHTKQSLIRSSNANQNLRKQSSGRWQMNGEEKDVLEELEKSEKNKMQKDQKKFIKTIEESKVNIMMSDSVASSIEKRYRKAKKKSSESTIRIEINEDSSNSKSAQLSIQQPKTRKKSQTIQPPEIEKNIVEKNESFKKIRNSQVLELSLKKQIPKRNQKRKSNFDIKDVILDAANLKQSQICYEKENGSIISFQEKEKSQVLQANEEPEEDDELASINLLAVSKISKEKSFRQSQKPYENEKANDDILISGKIQGSSILRKSKKSQGVGNLNQYEKAKLKYQMDLIEEQEHQNEEQQRTKLENQRRRKLSGTRYSLVDVKDFAHLAQNEQNTQ